MTAPERLPAPDQAERDAAIAERARNVVIDAGAGTGKTTILVERIVRMVAPPDGSPERSVPIGRIAAVTFTRRAAGELRLRIRERLLDELASPRTSAARLALLRDALGGLDTAHVGTIHSFADRMLRLRPVEARLSPSYEIVEDSSDLVRETFEILLHAAQTGSLTGELEGTSLEDQASEAERTVVDAMQAGLLTYSREVNEYKTDVGLDMLFAEFIDHRDVEPVLPEAIEFDRAAFVSAGRELVALAGPLAGDSIGVRWLRATARLIEGLLPEEDPVAILRSTRLRLRGPHDATKRAGFANDEAAWRAWKLYNDGSYKNEELERPLRDMIRHPLFAWLAPRLVRLFPVVIALYGKVKERHRQVDQIDLLLELRKLLSDDLASRAFYQSLFDHVLVDEFQDTDPLQAEIVVFLCEDGARASTWREARLHAGKLTIVGDPKQSIYRFRRADIAMYDEVRRLVTGQGHLSARLSANFRSVEPLIRYFNGRFAKLLGKAPDAAHAFDSKTGAVFHQDLDAGRSDGRPEPAVEILRCEFPSGGDEKTDGYRDLEAEMLACYIRRLVEGGTRSVKDPTTDEQRGMRYGDVAVLTLSTFTLPRLFRALDRLSVPYAARGGRLFLEDDLQRRFILALRALSNRDDGPAVAALLRPPFFAVDPLDLVRERAHRRAGADGPPDDQCALRAHEAREIVRELRLRRFERPPGATARALLETTALARTVALEPNGEQRLRHLRELCHVLETIAATDGLDFDGATERLRAWVDRPIQLDPPHPVGGDAVHVLTVHQAKGLEFPVVVPWDSCALLRSPTEAIAWRCTNDGRSWAIALHDLAWEEPRGADLRASEKCFRDAERKRLVYVAATRARELLVLPRAAMVRPHHVAAALTDDVSDDLAARLDSYVAGTGAPWSEGVVPHPPRSIDDLVEGDGGAASRWQSAAQAAGQPRFQPVGVTALVHDGDSANANRDQREARDSVGGIEGDDLLALPPKSREGRFGTLFGQTVHLAIARALRNPQREVAEIVRETATVTGLVGLVDEASADVARAVSALRAATLLGDEAAWRLEYPVCGADDGQLLIGYVDFLAVTPRGVHVVDFKTDAPPAAASDVPRKYALQVAAYSRLLRDAGIAGHRPLRAGLLFTAATSIVWLADEALA